MHIHDATIYSERNYAAIVYFKQVIHFLLLEKMKELKHMMIDLYFQGSPPLPLVMDFFIYQQLSLAFSVCPVQPALSLKCCVKHIPALAFCCQPKLFFALAANRLLIFQHQIPHAFTFYITMCLAMAGSGWRVSWGPPCGAHGIETMRSTSIFLLDLNIYSIKFNQFTVPGNENPIRSLSVEHNLHLKAKRNPF